MPEAAPDRWALIDRLYHAALEHDAAARRDFLADACAGDDALRAEVESLLAYETKADQFLTRPALEQAARALPTARAGALVGRQIHGYEVRALLGAGGMGEVYLAHDLRLGRDVALKILRRSVAADPGYLRRFEAEARSASVLNHPNIVTIYGVGDDGDIGYIAMERVNGRTLTEIIASANLAVPAVLELAVQLVEALAVAHDNGIVHRDLKPDNVMVTPEGLVKVLDFGIAKREGALDDQTISRGPAEGPMLETQAGTILGTVGYMSPEQAAGRRASPASDQFSFGAILYELLTGRRAFARSSKQATLDAILHDQPEPIHTINANVPPALRRVLDRCLAKDPAARYGRTQDLAIALREVRERLAGGGLTRRQLIWLGTAAAATVVSSGGLLWGLWPRGPRVRSLALLPFENVARDPDLDYLVNGLTDDLILRIGTLRTLPAIQVMTHSLVSNFKSASQDALAFGREIGADSVLTGTVTRRAGNLTIAATLREVSGKTLWSNSYERPASDLQDLRDDIAREIVDDAIRLQLSEADRARLSRRATTNGEAYELFLKARDLHELQTEDGNLFERDLLIQAVDLDPTFAMAYPGIAATYSTAAVDGYEEPGPAWGESLRNVRIGLNRDPDLLDAHAENATREFFYHWDWAAADREWALAMRSTGAGMFPFLLTSRALQQWALGHTSDAVRTIRAVRVVDRLSPVFIVKEGLFLFGDRQFDEAARAYESALRASPDLPRAYFGLAEVRRAQGRFPEAIAYRRLVEKDPALDQLFATARGEEGYRRIERAASEIGLEECELRKASGLYVPPYDVAKLHAQLGDRRQAFHQIERAFAVRDPGLVFLNVDHAWDSMRARPEFIAAVKKVGLPAS